jgi:putative oxidoreductase
MSAHGVEIGLLVLRVVTGLLWFGHGTQKLLGWFGAKRRGTLEGEFSHFGYHPPLLFGRMAGGSEVTGGLLLACGFATPVGGLLLACVAVQATVAVKWPNGPWIQDDGYEYLAVLAAIGVSFAFIGAGQLSLDSAFGTGFAGVGAGVVAAVVAGLTPLLPRRLGAAGSGEVAAVAHAERVEP